MTPAAATLAAGRWTRQAAGTPAPPPGPAGTLNPSNQRFTAHPAARPRRP